MIKAEAQVEINANVGAVWNILTDFANWPEWNKDVQKMAFNDRLHPGAVFKWKAGFSITSTLQEVDPPILISWTGEMLGIQAAHEWKLKSKGPHTLVDTNESWEGLLVKAFPKYFEKTLRNSLENGLAMLKTAAEKR